MTEQLTFDQFGRDGGTIHLDIRHRASCAHLVKTPGDQFLTGTVRAGDQNPGIGRRHLRDDVTDMPDGIRLSDHLVTVDLLLQGLVLSDNLSPLSGIADGNQNPVEIQRLLYEIEGSLLDAFHGSVDVTVSGHHHHSGLFPILDQFIQDFGSIHSRHLDVTENDTVLFLVDHRQGCRSVFGHLDFITFIPKNFLQRVPDGSLIIYNKYLHFKFVIGQKTTGSDYHKYRTNFIKKSYFCEYEDS